MSYQIQYSPELEKQYPTKQKRSPLLFIIICAVLLILYAVFQSNITNVFNPGDEAVTAAAFSGLVESVESGVSVRESLLAFCREIIESGK